MTTHTCNYFCDKQECVRAQRDFLRDRVSADEDLLRRALEVIDYYHSFEDYFPTPASEFIPVLRARLGISRK